MTWFTVFACAAYLLWLIWEKHRACLDRAALKHVIHVNGIRGKSSVSRLIDAGLRAGGLRVFTKTTGSCPAIIGVDGSEEPLRRWGKPSIKEQLRILGWAAGQHAEVLVIECMAVLPEYQRTSEEGMLRADIGVITNVRLDHPEEMGETLDEIAEALSATIPAHGTLFTADAAYHDFFAAKALNKGTSVVLSDNSVDSDDPDTLATDGIDFAENVSLALTVCEHLGVERDIALAGMRQYRKDPGAFSVETMSGKGGCRVMFLNALAANDPASSEQILDQVERRGLMASGQRMLLVNNRHDRPARLRQFVDFAVKHDVRFDRIVAAGACRSLMRRALVKRGVAPERIASLRDFSDLAELEEDTVVFAVGNIVGSGRLIAAGDRKAGVFDVR